MKRKIDKSGINLAALICLVVVMALIISTITLSFNNIYISTKKKEFANEIYTIQKMVEEYHFKYGKYPIVSEDTKELDLYELGVNETNRGRKSKGNDDIYVVNEENGKVTYQKGVNIGGKTYYTLEDNSQDRLKLKESGE